MALGTLDGMSLGGMYDLVGGGFHRYSVDEPLAGAALREDAVRQRPAGGRLPGGVGGHRRARRCRAVAERTLDYMVRELRLPEGGFASSQDADTDGHEGVTYVWTPSQLRRVLGGPDADAAIAHYGVTEQGNFEGANILRATGPPPANLAEIRSRLLEARDGAPAAGPRRQGAGGLERAGAGRPGSRAAGGCAGPT